MDLGDSDLSGIRLTQFSLRSWNKDERISAIFKVTYRYISIAKHCSHWKFRTICTTQPRTWGRGEGAGSTHIEFGGKKHHFSFVSLSFRPLIHDIINVSPILPLTMALVQEDLILDRQQFLLVRILRRHHRSPRLTHSIHDIP